MQCGVCVETIMRMYRDNIKEYLYVHVSVHRIICVFVSIHCVVYLCVVLFWNAVMGVNLMQGEGKAWSVGRHRRDHSLQCA